MLAKTARFGFYILAFMGSTGHATQTSSQNKLDPERQEALIQERDKLEDLYFKLYCTKTYMDSNFHSDEHLKVLANLQIMGESSEGLLGQVTYIKNKVYEVKIECWRVLMALTYGSPLEAEERFCRLRDAARCLGFSEEETAPSLPEEENSKEKEEYRNFLNEKIITYSDEIINYLKSIH